MEKPYLSNLLKLIAQPERMALLFALLEGDRNVNELAQALDLPATIVSTHLAKLRAEGIVEYTRYHRIIEYRLISEDAAEILYTLRRLSSRTEN
ncbi:ArsR/SmtB family transcription factor [Bergeriella denitrificans]|uniref:ArsR family transcriptional regulator n=1 Tax=Bergeriella denitrificans TaxID=494 RepID=A0A378UGV0_BERDE|nr:metalloregulator ArsR/SmtB family transcription factor [Bergeriella denitrificans]STZ76604.1 ArsR family transcriptional regulator [Bergeriella denitrificans]